MTLKKGMNVKNIACKNIIAISLIRNIAKKLQGILMKMIMIILLYLVFFAIKNHRVND